MTREGKEKGTLGTTVMQFFANKPSSFKELVLIVVLAYVVFVVSARFDVFNKIVAWLYQHDTWQLDELLTVTIYLLFAAAFYAWRRYRELIEQTLRREQAEAEKARLTPRLERALADVAHLKKLLPMCSSCKRIRNEKGYWDQVEAYIEINFATRLETGICADCASKSYRRTHTLHELDDGS